MESGGIEDSEKKDLGFGFLFVNDLLCDFYKLIYFSFFNL